MQRWKAKLGELLVAAGVLLEGTPARSTAAEPASALASTQSIAYRLHGLNFSPYLENQDPDRGSYVSEPQLRERMAIIAPYTSWIRTFGCTHGLEAAGRIAREFGLKVAMGAWIGRDNTANEKEIANLIAAARAGQVDIAIVGSEVMLRRDVSEAQLLEYLARVKRDAPGIPVTTADVYGELLARPAILNAVDVIFVNYYSYWEGYGVDVAVGMIHFWHQQVVAHAAGKPVIVSETGWPSAGEVRGNAVPSAENAAYFFINFVSWARANGVSYFYFEAFDEPWKTAKEGPQGAHWGIWDKNGFLKAGMQAVFDGGTIGDNWSGTALPGGPGKPAIELTYVPPFGSSDDLEGRILHIQPVNVKVLVYIKAPWPPGGGWWVKPSFAQPLTSVAPDGSWKAEITTGGVDNRATEIAAFLVPDGYQPALLAGAPALPPELEANAIAKVHITRSAHSISGRVLDLFSQGVGGVTLSLSGERTAATRTVSSGRYSFYDLAEGGSYRVTPEKIGFTFSPASAEVRNLSGASSLDFVASSNQAPSILEVSPATGSGFGSTWTFTVQDANGWQDLSVINVLISFWLDGRAACYLAFVPRTGSLFLVDDAGNAAGPYAGMVLPGDAVISNSQCVIYGAGSSFSGGGTFLTLKLNIGFRAGFAGTKIVYVAARDAGGSSSGWQRLAVWSIPGGVRSSPSVEAMSPQRGSGTGEVFRFWFADFDGHQDLEILNILVNDWLDGRHACYIAYVRSLNGVYLVNDAGDALSPILFLGSGGSVQNSQCRVSASGATAGGSGPTFTLQLPLVFASTFSGNRVFYLAARDRAGHNSGWQAMGTWTVR